MLYNPLKNGWGFLNSLISNHPKVQRDNVSKKCVILKTSVTWLVIHVFFVGVAVFLKTNMSTLEKKAVGSEENSFPFEMAPF